MNSNYFRIISILVSISEHNRKLAYIKYYTALTINIAMRYNMYEMSVLGEIDFNSFWNLIRLGTQVPKSNRPILATLEY